MTSPTPLDPQTMERLAFIRLLHQQGVDQARQPQPLNFSCVLTFHDAVELFLMLAGEHLGAAIPEKGRFVDRYFDNLNKHLNGTELSGRKGVGRLTDQRNAFKHANTWPGPTGIDQFRSDAGNFFEENTPKVFGIDFHEIDMADLVTQYEARKLIKEAAAADNIGDRVKAMGLLGLAFKRLFREHIGYSHRRSSSPFSFGPDIDRPMREGSVASILTQHECHTHRDMYTRPTVKRKDSGQQRSIESLARQITAVTEATSVMQEVLRVTAIGVEYHRYARFDRLTPDMAYETDDGELAFSHAPNYAPSDEEVEYCRQFVVTVSLRLAEIEAHTAAPSWL